MIQKKKNSVFFVNDFDGGDKMYSMFLSTLLICWLLSGYEVYLSKYKGKVHLNMTNPAFKCC